MKSFTLLLCTLVGVLSGCSKPREAKPLAVAALTNAAPAEEAGAILKLQWKTGKKYLMRMETIQSWDVQQTKSQPSSKQTLSMSHDYAVSALNGLPSGGSELEWEFMAQKLQLKMGPATMLSFDSAVAPSQDVGNLAAPVLRKLIGGKIRCQIDGDGNILKVDGFRELQAHMSQGQPGVQSMLQDVLSEQNFRQLASFIKVIQPDQPQKVGDEWPVHMEMADAVGTLIMNLTCTFKDWEVYEGHRCARIEFDGLITSRPPNPAVPISIEGGKISGRILYDPALAMVVTSASDQHMLVKTPAPKASATQCHVTTNVRLVKITDR